MSHTENNKVKTDRAWNKLYARFDSEGLLPVGDRHLIRPSRTWRWAGVAAAVLFLCVYIASSYFKTETVSVTQSLLTQENKETSTLVTTLEDGSIVYLGGETSLQYPEHFLPEKREVALQGKALFDVAGNRKRPFLIETGDVQIEVIGTAFNVKSDGATPFELSVQRGKVKVTLKKSGQAVYVQAGETVTLVNKDLHLSSNKDAGQFARYLESMRFKDESLNNILRVVNLHAADAQLQASPSLGERRLTVAFSNDTPQSMAELICLAMNLQCKREGNILTLSE